MCNLCDKHAGDKDYFQELTWFFDPKPARFLLSRPFLHWCLRAGVMFLCDAQAAGTELWRPPLGGSIPRKTKRILWGRWEGRSTQLNWELKVLSWWGNWTIFGKWLTRWNTNTGCPRIFSSPQMHCFETPEEKKTSCLGLTLSSIVKRIRSWWSLQRFERSQRSGGAAEAAAAVLVDPGGHGGDLKDIQVVRAFA